MPRRRVHRRRTGCQWRFRARCWTVAGCARVSSWLQKLVSGVRHRSPRSWPTSGTGPSSGPVGTPSEQASRSPQISCRRTEEPHGRGSWSVEGALDRGKPPFFTGRLVEAVLVGYRPSLTSNDGSARGERSRSRQVPIAPSWAGDSSRSVCRVVKREIHHPFGQDGGSPMVPWCSSLTSGLHRSVERISVQRWLREGFLGLARWMPSGR